MTKSEFITLVKNDLTMSCALPMAPRDSEISRLIDLASKWFYHNYEYACEERLLVVPVTAFSTQEFKIHRTLSLPDCVMAVTSFKVLNENWSSSVSFDGTRDMGYERLFMQSLDGGGGSMAAQGDAVMYYVVGLYWLDMVSSLFNHTISYNFNYNTKKLVIIGETPSKDCVALCYMKVPLESLMEDQLFYRYVTATAKIQMSRIMGTFNFTYPGDVTMNTAALREEGKDELDEIKQEIKDSESPDFFITTGGQ